MPTPPKRVVVSNKQVGERIRLLRKERGMTQVQLAKALQVTQSNVSAIERGARGVTVQQVVRIAKILDASTDEILIGEKAPKGDTIFKSRRLLRRLKTIEELTDRDRRVLLHLLDGFVANRREKLQARS